MSLNKTRSFLYADTPASWQRQAADAFAQVMEG